jgi:hypothetical protein
MKKNAAGPARRLGAILGLVLLAFAGSISAEPNLEGVWSGIFTTRHDPYWKIEDWACFNGCPPITLEHLKVLLADPKNDPVPVFALLGQSWQVAREAMRPNVIGKGVEIFDTINDTNDPTLSCQPYKFAREVVNALPIRISRSGKNLVIDYEEWSQTRTIYLDGRAVPKKLKPTAMGFSIGRWEGDALIVDTVGLSPDIFYPQYAGGGYSENARGHERYTVADNPRRLLVELKVEDPTMLKVPFVVNKVWLYKPDMKLVKDSCKDYPTRPAPGGAE